MISLYQWSKREGVSYSHAQKLFVDGKIEGATRTATRIKVPETTALPPRITVKCAICGRDFPQITNTHLKLHEISWDEYRSQYPDWPTVGGDVSAAISQKLTGRSLSDYTKALVSKNRSGIPAWNKGLTGVYTASEKTREKMSLAHTGLMHTEDAKRKIGDAHRGKTISADQIRNQRLRMQEFFKNFPHPFLGKQHTEESVARMTEAAIRREANYTPEQRAAINKAIGDGGRGIKRTPEQKERYRESRVKWMSENPSKVINTAGERSIAEWLDRHRIGYVRQYVIAGLHHPYDFFLPDHDTIIEFDGAHHWFRRWFNILGKTKAERATMMQETMAKDAMENLYAGMHGYRIIRIRGVADAGDSTEYGSLEHQLELQGFLMP